METHLKSELELLSCLAFTSSLYFLDLFYLYIYVDKYSIEVTILTLLFTVHRVRLWFITISIKDQLCLAKEINQKGSESLYRMGQRG